MPEASTAVGRVYPALVLMWTAFPVGRGRVCWARCRRDSRGDSTRSVRRAFSSRSSVRAVAWRTMKGLAARRQMARRWTRTLSPCASQKVISPRSSTRPRCAVWAARCTNSVAVARSSSPCTRRQTPSRQRPTTTEQVVRHLPTPRTPRPPLGRGPSPGTRPTPARPRAGRRDGGHREQGDTDRGQPVREREEPRQRMASKHGLSPSPHRDE